MADRVHLLFAFDVGYEVLVEPARGIAQRLIPAASHERRLPRRYLEYQVAPIEVALAPCSLAVGSLTLHADAAVRLFDFGGLVISFRLPMPTSPEERLQLSQLLRFKPPVDVARAMAVELMTTFHDAIVRPQLYELSESYVVLEFAAGGDDPATFLDGRRAHLAELLRGEGGLLSAQEIEDALRSAVAFTPSDLVIADYDAALLFGLEPPDAEDVLDILEFANLQLLELRSLDRRLDRRINELYGSTAVGGDKALFAFRSRASRRKQLSALAELKLDSAMLAERLQNAFKIIGDLYYARIYRAASQRLHLGEWEASSERKLRVVGEIYDATLHALESRRFEALEWIIILLIAAELVMGFLR